LISLANQAHNVIHPTNIVVIQPKLSRLAKNS